MSRRLTVDDLVADVRSAIDEDNQENIRDVEDIIPALNRAQDYATNILVRHYESPLLKHTELSLVAGQNEYDIPEDALEQRLEMVEVNILQVFYEVKRLSYRDITRYETSTNVNVPYYYVIIGEKFRLVPAPSSRFPLRLWYLKDPPPLVKSQGTITKVNTANNYIIVDAIGSDLTTESDQLNSYVNIVDGTTGVIKSSHQIKSIDGTRINFKSSPTQSEVRKQTISSSIPSTVEFDDLVCVVSGVCIPFFKKPFSNFLIQYAKNEMRNKLGQSIESERILTQQLEEQVERSWVGREQSLRIQKRNKLWSQPARRFYHGFN